MLVFLLILFGENSYPALVFEAQHSTSWYQLRKFTVYRATATVLTNEENFASSQFLFYQVFTIGSDVSLLTFYHKSKSLVSVSVVASVTISLLIGLRFYEDGQQDSPFCTGCRGREVVEGMY